MTLKNTFYITGILCFVGVLIHLFPWLLVVIGVALGILLFIVLPIGMFVTYRRIKREVLEQKKREAEALEYFKEDLEQIDKYNQKYSKE